MIKEETNRNPTKDKAISEMRCVLGWVDEAITESTSEIELADTIIRLCHNIDQAIKNYDKSLGDGEYNKLILEDNC